MTKTKNRIVATKVADANHVVHTVVGCRNGHRKEPCPQCPWRTDVPAGVFPAEAFRHSARTAYDAATEMFACHMSGSEKPATCAGFLLANADNNVGVRLAMSQGKIDPAALKATAPLYSSYRAMAIANGVDPNDPVLEPCRANDE